MVGLFRDIDYLICSVIIAIILIITTAIKYKSVSKANKSFVLSLILLLISCILEIFVTVTRSYPQNFNPFFMHVLRSLYSIANGFLAVFVYIYARSYSGSFEEKRNWADVAAIIASLAYTLISVINIPTGIVTWIEEDGTFVHGPLYIVTFLGVGLIISFAFVSTIMDRKYYTKGQFLTINLLYAMIAFSTVLEILIDSRTLLISFGIAIGLLSVFMSLESPDYVKAVAARKEAEKARVEADKANAAKSDFLARMSHEIRTPMNAIMGMNEMIINSTHEDQTKIYSSDAYNAAHNLLDIINDILDFSRIESGKLDLIEDKYSLTSILRDLWVVTGSKAKEKGLTLEFDIDPELHDERNGDRVRIRQILINLLNNAVKYTDEGKVILKVSTVSSNQNSDVVKYEIIDTGRGIKEEDRQKLFEAFSRIEENRSTNIAGTGLGINITTSLLKLMGSELMVESEYGKGSNFYFVLEQNVLTSKKVGNYEEVKVEEVVVSESKIEVSDKRIMCVDDTPLNLKVFRAFLKDSSNSVDLAESAKDALVLTLKNKYDLIFMDHLMPEIDGVECFNMIKNQEGGLNCDTPVIVLTANAIKGATEKYSEIGFADVCFKPYTKDQLIKMINKHLS